MCGISGILSPSEFSARELQKLTNLITHRGPDDEGYLLVGRKSIVAGGHDTPDLVWQSRRLQTPDCQIQDIVEGTFSLGMGHRRLSIIDLTAGGHQPLCDSTRKLWIVFNGEIYNYKQLRSQLSDLGHQFLTDSDTEVLLCSFKQWGKECLDRLEGMWSFVIYDSTKNRLFFARDRFGIKPLYFWTSPDGDLYWGSEIKQFTSCPKWVARLNHKMALDYLMYAMTDHTSETMFQGVTQLSPGCYLDVDIDQFRSSKSNSLEPVAWYHIPEIGFQGSFEEACTEFKKQFFYAIESHLQADVPVGSALSGGIDSSSIVCAIHRLLQLTSVPQKTFSSCSYDPRFDERYWVEEILKEKNLEAYFVYPKGDEVFKKTDELIWSMDEPYQSQSVFLGAAVFELARANDVRVLLNGQGADEYINCYEQLQLFLFSDSLKAGQFGDYFRLLRKANHSKKMQWLTLMLERKLPGPTHLLLRRYSASKSQRSLFGQSLDFDKFQCEVRHPYLKDKYRRGSARQITERQLLTDPLPKYLRWEDRNSMACSIEARVPFLCHPLVEFTCNLPTHYKTTLAEPKRIVTESLKGCLTESVRKRREKMGFTTPEQNWLMRDNVDDFKRALAANLDYSQGLICPKGATEYLGRMQSGRIPFNNNYWRLIAFCIWMRVFSVHV